MFWLDRKGLLVLSKRSGQIGPIAVHRGAMTLDSNPDVVIIDPDCEWAVADLGLAVINADVEEVVIDPLGPAEMALINPLADLMKVDLVI